MPDIDKEKAIVEKEIVEKYLNDKEGAKNDLSTHQKSFEEKKETYSNSSALQDVLDYVPLFFSLVQDYFNNTLPKDFKIDWADVVKILAAIVYLVTPIDAIPDLIPALGLTDDAGVLAIAITSLEDILNKYKITKS